MDAFDPKKLYNLEEYQEPKSAIQQDIDEANDNENRLNAFLDTISMIESSGGKNFDHRPIESGIHEGHSAAGKYGLMPNTIKEVINRKVMNNRGEDLKPLLQKEPDQLKTHVESNPEIEQRLARTLAEKVLNQYNNDEEKAAYSWLYGHNLPEERLEKRNYKDDDYVKKYRNYKNLVNSFSKNEDE